MVLVIEVDGDDNEAPAQNTETSHGTSFQVRLVRGERIEDGETRMGILQCWI
jgi:hypothetical protein